jgi:4-amino-4-deoxy-L-arabinose transferase-like glycosyltransferase
MRVLRLELALVVIVAIAALAPGISHYTLVDPWETHYGEVAREIRQNHDWAHLDWAGGYLDPNEHEGFRSKPVLSFWLMAASMSALGVADNGGYSGEMVASPLTMLAVRLPFVLTAVLGLVLMWFMLARLVSRRLAWLALLVVGSTPMFALVARQAIPDMPHLACLVGALSLFTLSIEDGDRPAGRHLHVLLALVGAFVVVQCVYYTLYFRTVPRFAVVFPFMMLVPFAAVFARPQRLATMRQVYALWAYTLLGLGVLAKGPPGLAVFVVVAVLYVVLLGRWRDVRRGAFEIVRGLTLMTVVFLPWHVAMYFADGRKWLNEYLFFHILSRGGSGVDNSTGTLATLGGQPGGYAGVIGHGMWLWAALLPAALAAVVLRVRTDTREGRVRLIVALWALGGTALFLMIGTKFNHYILPVVPALGIIVAFFLDDVLAGRERLHPLFALVGIAIALLVTRDLMFEPERWIEMFVYRYDRPWPAAIDVSDGFLALGILAAAAIAALALPWRRFGVTVVGVAGIAICLWSLHVYMPIAGTNWGMGSAIRTYYKERTIYGEKLVYSTARQVHDDWHDVRERWSFDSFIPDTLQVGQPMQLTVQLGSEQIVMTGSVAAIGDHTIEVALPAAERGKLDAIVGRGASDRTRPKARPIRVVDADRLIAWMLYWRGENFWSGNEIFGPVPEMHTAFNKDDYVEFRKYLGDRARAPLGRRYFVITEAGRANNIANYLPTPRAKATFEILNTDSNKFTLASFAL